MRSLPRITLGWILVLGAIAAAAIVWGTTMPYTLFQSRSIGDRYSIETTQNRAEAAGKELVRTLAAQWYRARAMARFAASGQNIGELRIRFNTIEAANKDISWIGFADMSGKVVAASSGALEGKKVDDQQWFRAGVEGPYIGDKHDDLLLAANLSPEPNQSAMVIEFAMPVLRNKEKIGVIAMMVDWTWVHSVLASFARTDGLDMILLSRQGEVLSGPADLIGKKLSLPSVIAASQGVKISHTETWPDGVSYLLATAPVPSNPDFASFGWSILVRQPVETALAPVAHFTSRALTLSIAAAVLSLLIALSVARILSRPMARLAEAAHDLAQGQYRRPIPEERAYSEVARLAAALVRLQSTVLSQTEAPEAESAQTRRLRVL